LVTAPIWALAVALGTPIALVLAPLLHYGRHDSWPEAGVAAVLCGALGGAMTALSSRRRATRSREAIGEAAESVQDRVASRATLRGPLPDDPAERAATVRLIDSQIAELRSRRVGTLVLFPAVIALFGWIALVRAPWAWLAVAVAVAAFVFVLRTPGMLERRADRLRQGSTDG
jgi:Flp pilus assembly protein TadB